MIYNIYDTIKNNKFIIFIDWKIFILFLLYFLIKVFGYLDICDFIFYRFIIFISKNKYYIFFLIYNSY